MKHEGIKKKEIDEFLSAESSSVNAARTLILFGRNTSTYKFALWETLLALKPSARIKFEDIGTPFVKSLLRHYEKNKSQFQDGGNALTKTMDKHISGEVDFEAVLSTAEKVIYNNVFDAFHNVGGGSLVEKSRLFEKDNRSKSLYLTDNLNQILENSAIKELLLEENESRWRVVEEAWLNKLNPNFLDYNKSDGSFESIGREKRTNLRSAVNVLSPYQHNKCFYCNRPLDNNATVQEDAFPDIDHFLPFSIIVSSKETNFNPNGIWNLVVSCRKCNRGSQGKFDNPPKIQFFEKLKRRNLLYVEEHKHSLRNSILISLSAADKKQVSQKMDALFRIFQHIKGWEPREKYD